MRLLVQRASAVGLDDAATHPGFLVEILDLRRHVEEAFGPQKVPVPWLLHAFGDAQVLVQYGVGSARAKTEVFRAAFGVEP